MENVTIVTEAKAGKVTAGKIDRAALISKLQDLNAKEAIASVTTVSEKIRILARLGLEKAEISVALGVDSRLVRAALEVKEVVEKVVEVRVIPTEIFDGIEGVQEQVFAACEAGYNTKEIANALGKTVAHMTQTVAKWSLQKNKLL